MLCLDARPLIEDVNLVLDGMDNFETRYIVNRACLELGTPWIFGGVLGMAGMSLPILPGGPCLHCALGPKPPAGTVPTTAELGVLSSIVATIASVEVVRAIKIIIGRQLEPNLIVVDLDRESLRTIPIERNPACPACKSFH